MYSRKLAELITGFKYHDLDETVIDMTKKCIMDYLGVSIAGYDKEPSLIWKKLIDQYHTKEEATILNPKLEKTNYLYAACINAAYGHVLDMDDLHNVSIVHPAVITIPVALALGQHLKKSMQDIIVSIVVGYDVAARVGEAINPSSYQYWHTTSIAGNFSAAATAGILLDLSCEEMEHCLGNAGSQAAGLWQFINDGAMTKTLHVGKACMNGIMTAELSKMGFTGALKILEGDKGLIGAVSSENKLHKLIDDFGKPFKIMENSFKPYACCRHTHSANYAIEKIVSKYKITAEDIKLITDRTYKTAMDVTNNSDPQTVYAHKFSLQYCIAACLVYGNLLEDVFTEKKISNPIVQETMRKIKLYVDEDINNIFIENPDRWIHDLEVETNDGRLLKERIEYPIGDVNNPFDWDMCEYKFRMLIEPYYTSSQIDTFIKRIRNFENIEQIDALYELS